MALPSNFDTITVQGSYVDFLGDPPPSGSKVDFEPSFSALKHIASDLIIFKAIRSVDLAADGTFSIVLPVTNDPDVTPSFQYSVTENIKNSPTRKYTVDIPLALLPGPVNLADLVVIGTPTTTGSNALTRTLADSLYVPQGQGIYTLNFGQTAADIPPGVTPGTLIVRKLS